MNLVFLGLGTNLGNRRDNLENAIRLLQPYFQFKLELSPVYETPALIPSGAPNSWQKSFFNMVVTGRTMLSPQEMFKAIKNIEHTMGRQSAARGAPRVMDIDILLWNDEIIKDKNLQIPHPQLARRNFVLNPLKDLCPDLKIPGTNQTVFQLSKLHREQAPLWMAILNVTPDSFSDGGQFSKLETIDSYIEQIEDKVSIIDVGAEATGPKAAAISWQEEWARLEPVLNLLQIRFANKMTKPQISVDTRHVETAERALVYNVDIINDVSGMTNRALLELIAPHSCQYVLMHSLSVPARPSLVMDEDISVMDSLRVWFQKKLLQLEEFGISRNRIIIDPGIGFGKTGFQSLEILKNIDQFMDFQCRLLIGHSRKSFLKVVFEEVSEARDLESIGISLQLAQRGVDILRVHNPLAHIQAFRAFQQTQPAGSYLDEDRTSDELVYERKFNERHPKHFPN